jgi:hypothetical protein
MPDIENLAAAVAAHRLTVESLARTVSYVLGCIDLLCERIDRLEEDAAAAKRSASRWSV